MTCTHSNQICLKLDWGWRITSIQKGLKTVGGGTAKLAHWKCEDCGIERLRDWTVKDETDPRAYIPVPA